jgi:phosphoenolpyruvate carboxylase
LDRGQIHFPPKREPLRDEVHALGALMGEILREQGGAELFTLVEAARHVWPAPRTRRRAM